MNVNEIRMLINVMHGYVERFDPIFDIFFYIHHEYGNYYNRLFLPKGCSSGISYELKGWFRKTAII